MFKLDTIVRQACADTAKLQSRFKGVAWLIFQLAMKIEKLFVNDKIKNHNHSNPLPSLAICSSLFVFSVSFYTFF